MTKSVTKIQDKDTNKRLSVVRSKEDPTKYGVVILNPDWSMIKGPQWPQGCPGPAGPSICSAEFCGNDIDFGRSDGCTVVLQDAKCCLKWDNWVGICCTTCTKVGKETTVELQYTNWTCFDFSVCDWLDWEWSWDVVWPSCATDWNVVLFDWSTWKLIKDGGNWYYRDKWDVDNVCDLPDENLVKGDVYNIKNWWDIEIGSEEVKTVTGNSYADLTDAIANRLIYLKLFGWTEQRNLPSWYTQYEYLRSSGTQYIDLWYKGNWNTKVEVKFKYYQNTSATGSGRVFGSRTTSSSNAFAIGTSSGVVASTGNKVFWCYDWQSFYVADEVQFGLDEWKTVIFSATEHKIDGTIYGDDYNVTEFETPSNLSLFAFDNNGTIGVGYVDIAYCKLWNNWVLVRDLIPCKDGSNVIGMYDRVSETLLTNAGTGTFGTWNTAVPTPEKLMNIVCNNWVLKLSKNMANVNSQTVLIGYYISAQGAVTADTNNWIYQDFIPVKPNTTYTLTISTPVWYVTISEYSTADDSGFIIRNAGRAGDNTTLTITTGATTNYVRFGTNIDKTEVTLEEVLAINWQLEQWNTPTPYHEYVEWWIYTVWTTETVEDELSNTATAEMLLKVWDYVDEQEILSWDVTRNIGIKVMTGNETFQAGTNGWISEDTITDNLKGTYIPICTHFGGTDTTPAANSNTVRVYYTSQNVPRVYFGVDKTIYNTAGVFKQWLTDQYNAGTPVIIIYPLATATTKSVAWQTLDIQTWSNRIEITQASIDNLPLEIQYVSGSVQNVKILDWSNVVWNWNSWDALWWHNAQSMDNMVCDLSCPDNCHYPTTKAVDDALCCMLPNTTKYGASLDMNMDSCTYVLQMQLKDQDGCNLWSACCVDLPLESVVVCGCYDCVCKEVELDLQGWSCIRFGIGDLVCWLQTEIDSCHKICSDYVDTTGQTNQFVTATEKCCINSALQSCDLNWYAKSCDLCIVATSWEYCDLSGRVTDNCQIWNSCWYVKGSCIACINGCCLTNGGDICVWGGWGGTVMCECCYDSWDYQPDFLYFTYE